MRDHPEKAEALEEIFLCHAGGDAPEIRMLAEELRLRGVAPWVDKDGGFRVGDESAGVAERVIGEECFGLLFYATSEAFGSDFIRQVEIGRAVRRKEEEASFVLFALPRRMGFGELSERSIEAFGVDLAAYSSRALEGAGEAAGEPLRPRIGAVAGEVLDKVLGRARGRVSGTFQMQFSTRELLADDPEDVLRVDAVGMLEEACDPSSLEEAWDRIHEGLLDVKRLVSRNLGRPRLRVHGSKHLTAAYVLGHVFPSTVCEIEIRTKRGYWSTDHEPAPGDLLKANISDGTVGSEKLYVEISTGDKSVREGVRRHVRRMGVNPFKFLRFTPRPALESASFMSNADACAIARQVRRELGRVVSDYGILEVHLFAAIPQDLAVIIGHNLNAMPPIHLYEHDGGEYRPSHVLRGM